MKVLRLTLKKKWFDEIAAGRKTVEYREMKPYWDVRLKKRFDAILFVNGYRPASPRFLIECLRVKTAEYQGKEHCALVLGKIIG